MSEEVCYSPKSIINAYIIVILLQIWTPIPMWYSKMSSEVYEQHVHRTLTAYIDWGVQQLSRVLRGHPGWEWTQSLFSCPVGDVLSLFPTKEVSHESVLRLGFREPVRVAMDIITLTSSHCFTSTTNVTETSDRTFNGLICLHPPTMT